jgi:hypothetical protein
MLFELLSPLLIGLPSGRFDRGGVGKSRLRRKTAP